MLPMFLVSHIFYSQLRKGKYIECKECVIISFKNSNAPRETGILI